MGHRCLTLENVHRFVFTVPVTGCVQPIVLFRMWIRTAHEPSATSTEIKRIKNLEDNKIYNGVLRACVKKILFFRPKLLKIFITNWTQCMKNYFAIIFSQISKYFDCGS